MSEFRIKDQLKWGWCSTVGVILEIIIGMEGEYLALTSAQTL